MTVSKKFREWMKSQDSGKDIQGRLEIMQVIEAATKADVAEELVAAARKKKAAGQNTAADAIYEVALNVINSALEAMPPINTITGTRKEARSKLNQKIGESLIEWKKQIEMEQECR